MTPNISFDGFKGGKINENFDDQGPIKKKENLITVSKTNRKRIAREQDCPVTLTVI